MAVAAPALAGELVTACVFSPATCSDIVVAVSEGIAGTSIATNTTAGKTALRLLEDEAARVGKIAIPSGMKAIDIDGLPSGSQGVVDLATGEVKVLTWTGKLTEIPPASIPTNVNATGSAVVNNWHQMGWRGSRSGIAV